jgi:hypothetical protein
MLVATRDHQPRANERHFPPEAAPRSRMSHVTGAIQLVGSLIGIPLALASAYSIYHTNFSPEAKCQSLRANIVAMLDRQADASTLRMLVHRDIVSFERDCGEVDADAVAAFKTLLAAERTPPARHVEPRPKTETAIVTPPAKPVPTAKTEAAAKIEPAAKPDASKKAQAAVPVVAPAAAKREPAAAQELKPVEASIARRGNDAVDADWVASVRETLRESAARPQAVEAAPEQAPPIAAPMPAPIIVPAQASSAIPGPAAAKPDHPVPPASIPNPPGSAASAN